MKTRNVILAVIILATTFSIIGIFAWFNSNMPNVETEKGFLEGNVIVGPLCPVEPCTPTEEQVERAYEARNIIIYTPDKATVVTTVSLDKTGKFKVPLDPGRYVVDINRAGIDSSSDVPKAIIIKSGETVYLDIHIDTGIR